MIEKDFETLLGEVFDSAYRVAFLLTKESADAEELMQDAAFLAFRGFSTFGKDRNFKAWFLTILRNRFIDTYRKHNKFNAMQVLDFEIELIPAKNSLIRGADFEQIMKVFQELPVDFREVSIRYFVREMSYKEIASDLDLPIGTVRSRLYRSRQRLRHKLGQLADEYGISQKD